MSHYDIDLYCSKCGAYAYSVRSLTKIEKPILCSKCRKSECSTENSCACRSMSDFFVHTWNFNFCPYCGKALKDGFISGYEIGKGT